MSGMIPIAGLSRVMWDESMIVVGAGMPAFRVDARAILGGGVGGLVAANRLRKQLPAAHRVVLIDREPSFTFAPSFLWVMTGARSGEQIGRPPARRWHAGRVLFEKTWLHRWF
jgi:NADPH-dependent 2,4-dienoyl-CoA reductase/sulfur reductase-like enzyme